MPMRFRPAVVRVTAVVVLALTPAMLAVTADGGPLEPLGKIFKQPADTLKGLVQPKERHAAPPPADEAPPAEPLASEAAAPKPQEPTQSASAPGADSVPTPRLRPTEAGPQLAEAPAPPAFDDAEYLPLDLDQHEDAIAAMITARSLGAVHKAANPDPEETTEPGQPLLSYAPSDDDIAVTPNLRPKTAALAPDLQEERSSAILGVLRQGGSCSKTLTSLGVTAVAISPIRKGSCSVASPVEVAALGGGAVQLSAKATVNCDVASTLAAFMRDVVDPLARQKLGGSVTDVRVASSYACRSRNNVAGAPCSGWATRFWSNGWRRASTGRGATGRICSG